MLATQVLAGASSADIWQKMDSLEHRINDLVRSDVMNGIQRGLYYIRLHHLLFDYRQALLKEGVAREELPTWRSWFTARAFQVDSLAWAAYLKRIAAVYVNQLKLADVGEDGEILQHWSKLPNLPLYILYQYADFFSKCSHQVLVEAFESAEIMSRTEFHRWMIEHGQIIAQEKADSGELDELPMVALNAIKTFTRFEVDAVLSQLSDDLKALKLAADKVYTVRLIVEEMNVQAQKTQGGAECQ